MLPTPFPARELTSLDVVSCNVVRPLDSAGSRDGALMPDGRAFSTCDGGRSMVAMRTLACQGGRQMGMRRMGSAIIVVRVVE